jgi:hypothetical protein
MTSDMGQVCERYCVYSVCSRKTGPSAVRALVLCPCSDHSQPRNTLAMRRQTEPDNLLLELAFAIEDPCGALELELARAILILVRSAPPEARQDLSVLFRRTALQFCLLCELKSQVV